jgi:Flp pilus assembly protein TadD
MALAQGGRREEAIELLGQAAAQDPLDPRYPTRLAMLLADEGRFYDAERELRAALAWQPESPTLSANLEVLEHVKMAAKTGGKER